MAGRTNIHLARQQTGGLPHHVNKLLLARIRTGDAVCDLRYREAYRPLAHLLDDFGVIGSAVRQEYVSTLRRRKNDIDRAEDGGLKPLLLARMEDHLKKNRTRRGASVAASGSSAGRPDDRCRHRFGFTLDAYIAHLESRFTKGMTWERVVAGDVQTDHILPVRVFDLSTREGVHAAYALDNTQPLWRGDNARKGRTVDRDWIALFGEGTIRG